MYNFFRKVFLGVFLFSIMLASNVLYAMWNYSFDSGQYGYINDGNWCLEVWFPGDDTSRLTITSVDQAKTVNESLLNLADNVSDGKKIVAINPSIFASRVNILRVTLPNTLESIGQSAFEHCTQIIEVSPFLPSSVTTIGPFAFQYCSAITNALVLSNKNLETIGAYAFRCMNNIGPIDCENSGIKVIGIYAFTVSKFPSIILSDCLEIVGQSAFESCSAVTNVSPFLPSSVTNIGLYAFQSCSAITNALVLSNKNLETISSRAFYCNSLIRSVDMSTSGVKHIGSEAFVNITNMVSLKLSDYVETVDAAAFEGCKALENVDPFLPSSIKYVGSYAFQTCPITTPLVLDSENPATWGINIFRSTKIPTVFFGVGMTNIDMVNAFGDYNIPITNVWFCGNSPTYISSLFLYVYNNHFLAIFYIPVGDTTWDGFRSGLMPLTDGSINPNDNELQDFKSKYPNEKATPIGKFIPWGASYYQYVCEWRPPDKSNKVTVIIIK